MTTLDGLDGAMAPGLTAQQRVELYMRYFDLAVTGHYKEGTPLPPPEKVMLVKLLDAQDAEQDLLGKEVDELRATIMAKDAEIARLREEIVKLRSYCKCGCGEAQCEELSAEINVRGCCADCYHTYMPPRQALGGGA